MYNLQQIMVRAWTIYRKAQGITFGEALHRSWLAEKAAPINAQRIREAQEAAGVQEEVNTWNGWKVKGFEVQHGAKALFQTVLVWGSRGDGAEYRASFFARSQVEPVAA